ncbi:MAG: lamin tail domain-containing protein [Myxococcota bacterium]
MLVLLTLAGCTVTVDDCQSDEECVMAFGEGFTCAADGACAGPGGTGDTALDPIIPLLTINEVLYDPSNDDPEPEQPPPGDANGDGTYDLADDEFVELVNVSGAILDISGYAVWDDEAWGLEQPRHIVPDGTVLEVGEAFVVFGGGVPTGTFGGAQVQVANGGRLNLNNTGDTLRVTRADGRITLTFEIEPRSNNPNESYTRNPDIIGIFEQHAENTPILFSPGTRVDGTPFR